ncbi:MAG TPA: hypothetical protein VFG87_21270, partial [Amycolatopsis sp.]|nr:hypothetical protein [Amycolatopsis sp.]
MVGKIDAALLRARILDLVGRSDDYPTLRRLVQLEFSDDKQTENWLHHRKGFGARANAGGPEITVRAVGLGPPRDQRRGITDFEHEHSRLPVDHSSSSERATTGSGSMFGRIWALYVMVQAQLDGMVNPRGAGLSTATRHESGTKVAESNVPSVTSRHNVGYEVTVDGNGRWPWSKPRSRTDHVAVGVELAWPDRPPANPAHDHGSALTRHELDAIEHIEFSAIDDIHDQVEQEIGGFRPNDPESVRFHTWLSSLDKSVLAEPVRNSFTFAGHGPTELMVAVGQPVEGGSPRPVTVRELPDENGTITNSEVTSAENTSVQWVDHQHGIGVRVAAGDASSPVTGWAIGPIDTERFSTKNDGAITERHQRESTETYTGGLAKRQADLTFVVMVRSSGKGPVIRFDEQKRLPVLAKPHHVVKVPNTATWWSRRTAQPRPSEAAGPTQRGEFQESSTVAGHRQVAEPAESGAVEVPSRPDRYRVTDRIDARYWLSREAAQAVVGRIMPELATPDLLPVRGARAQFVPFADRALHALAPKNPAGSVATAWVRFLGSASQALHRLASHPIRPDKLPWIRTRLLSFLTDNAREAATGEVRFPLGALLHDDKVPDIFIGVPAPPVAAEYLGVRTGEKLGGKIGASHEHRVVVTRRRDTVRGIAGIGYYEENNYPTYQAVYGTSTAHPRHVAREVGYERSFDSTEPVHRYRYQTPFRVSFGRSWSHRSGKTLEIDPLRWAPTVEVSAPGDPWPELPAAGVAVPHQPVTEHAADAPTDGTWHDGDPSDEPGIPVPAGVVPVSLNRVPGAVRTMSEMLSERRPGAWRPWSNVSRPFVGGNPPEFDEHTGGGHRSADPANLDEQNPALDWLEAFGSRQGRETGFDRAVLREDTTPPLKSHNFGGPLGSRDGFARVAYSIRLYRPRVLSGLVKRPVNQSIYTKTTLGGGVQETRRGSLAGDSLVVEPIVKTFATGVDAIVGLEYERNRSSDTERSVKITVSSEHGEYGYLLGVDATHVVRTSARRQWQDLFGFRHPTSAAARTRWRRVPDNEVWVPASEIHRIPGLSEGDIAKLAPDDQARYRQEQPVSEPQEGTHSAPQHLTGSAPSRLARSGSEVRPKPEAGAYPAPRDSMLRPPENAGRGRGTMEWYDQKAPIALIQQMDETLAEWSRQTGQADPAWSPGDLVNRVFGKPRAERDPTMPKFDELHEQLVSDELGPIMVGHRGNATLREMLNGGRAVLLQGDNVQQLVVLRARPGKGEYQRTIPNQTTRISHETVNRDGSSYRHGWLGQLGFGVLHMVGRSGEPAMLSITGALFTHSRMKGLERSQENRETLKAESSGDRLQFTHALTVDLDVYPYQGPGVYTRLLNKLLPGQLAELAPRVIGEPWRHEFTFRPGTVRSTVPREECVPVEPIESVTGSLREWQRDQQRSLGLSDDATLYVDQFPAPGLHTRLHEIIRGESEADRPRLPMRPGAANQLFADASRRADLLRDAMTEAGHVVDLIDGPVRRVKITVDLEQRELLGVVENGSRTRDVSQSENLKLTSDHKTEFGMTHTTQLRAPAVAGEGNRPVLGALSLGHPLAQRTREHQNEVSTETKSAEDNGEQTWYRVRVTPRWHVLGSGRREKLPAPARKVLRTGQWLASAGRRFPAFWRKVVRADQWLMLASADRQREFPDFLRKVLNTGRDGRSDEPIELVVNQRGLEDLGLHVPRVDDPLRDWLIYDRWLNPGQEGAPDGAGQDRAPADTAGPDRAEVTVDEIGGPFMSGALPPVERDHEVEATLAADEADPMSGRVVSAPESTEGTAGAES